MWLPWVSWHTSVDFLVPICFFNKTSFPQNIEPVLPFQNLTGVWGVSGDPRKHHFCVHKNLLLQSSCLHHWKMYCQQLPNVFDIFQRVPEKPFCDCSQWWLFCGGNYSLSEVQKCSQTQDWRPCCKKKKSPFQNTCQQIEVRLRLTSLSPLSLLVSVFPRKISRNSMQLIRQQSLSRDPWPACCTFPSSLYCMADLLVALIFFSPTASITLLTFILYSQPPSVGLPEKEGLVWGQPMERSIMGLSSLH